ncbi:hypothetical protein J2X36_003186 [Methylobacterium sp. BE186]|uniref:transporter n=1 Tax=Methylobacterium sp. BE186 TaxID=2817715 RepID=UPI00285B9244|nr:transporter [Methylobacterium sp. BE186]MDR7038422.1 hypothetical protein [Methylobacterium sp. BE186]
MMKNWLAAGAVALSVGMTGTAAFAQTTTVPGEQVGLAVGAPLPEGVYALNTFLYRSPDVSPVDVGINIPILLWSTPWKILDARVELAVAPPTVFSFGRGRNGAALDTSINVGTFVGGIFAWDLGNNVGVSYLAGVYLNELNAGRGCGIGCLPILSSNTYRQGFAISYTGDGWNLTANLTYNFYDTPSSFSGGFFPAGGALRRGPYAPSDALNLDLTATKKFGKWEIGAIGYGTTDLSNTSRFSPVALGGARQGYFALGGLIGYDFGPFTVQGYAARHIVNRVAGAEATEGWFRVIAPLYTVAAAPAPAPAPLIRKY